MTQQEGTVRLALSWPHKDLSPNARCHWALKAKAVKAARHDAGWAMRRTFRTPPPWKAVHIHWEFHPKTANVPDGDNAEASCKAYRDGIADALCIDDSKFTTTHSFGEPVKGGSVIVTVREA
jgi:crossover junction endodeoxyribonuclease RusA